MTEKARQAFATLKKAFVTAPMLAHFDLDQPLWLETDVSKFAIAGILLQPTRTGRVANDKMDAHWHPIAYWSQQKTPAEQRYIAKDSECLAIVALFKQWRHYLKGAKYPILVLTDNANLQNLMTTKPLQEQQARWWELLSNYDLHVRHRPGMSNLADLTSQCPDYKKDARLDLKANGGRALREMRMQGQLKPDPSINGKEAKWTWTSYQLTGTGTCKPLVPRPEQEGKGKTDNAPLPPAFL